MRIVNHSVFYFFWALLEITWPIGGGPFVQTNEVKAFQLLIVLVIGWWLLATKYSSYWSGVKIIFYQNPAPNVGYSKFSNRELLNRDPVGNSLFTDSIWDFNPADFEQYTLDQKRFGVAAKSYLCWRVGRPPALVCQHKWQFVLVSGSPTNTNGIFTGGLLKSPASTNWALCWRLS